MNASDFSETDRLHRKPVGILGLIEFSRAVAEPESPPAATVRMLYLGVEREQIPHLRLRGLNHIGPFGSTFNQEVGIAKTE